MSASGGEPEIERATGRVVALDLGSRRIGVAYCDSGRTLASPWGTVERSGDPVRDRKAVVEAIERFTTVEAQRSLTAAGRKGRAARSVIDSAAAMVLLQAWLDKA